MPRARAPADNALIATTTPRELMALYHPRAIQVAYADSGPFINVPPRAVWHITVSPKGSGKNLAHAYTGKQPTFQLDPVTNELWQFQPLNRSAKALANLPGGVETNHAHAIQIELVGEPGDPGKWGKREYANIAALARWIEKNAGVPRRALKPWNHRRMTAGEWIVFSGHCGHQHVPENDHTDPGNDFKIELVLQTTVTRAVKWAAELTKIRSAVRKIGHWTPKRTARAKKLERAITRSRR